MLKKSDSEECLMCNLRWKYDIFHFVFPLQFYCKHLKYRFSSKPFSEVCKWRQVLSVLSQFLFAVPVVPYFFYFPTVCHNNKLACLSLVSDQIFMTTSIFISTLVLMNIRKFQVEVNSWLYLFENRQKYNLGRMIQSSDCRKFKLYNILGLIVMIIELFIPVLYFNYTGNKTGNFFRRISISASFAIQAKGFFDMLKSVAVHSLVLKAFEASLQTILIRRLLFTSLPKVQYDGNVFRKFHQVIFVMNSCVKMHLKTFAFVVSVRTLVSIISMILNIYIWIRFSDGASSLTLLYVRTVFMALEVLVLLGKIETNINRKVSFEYNRR